MPEKAKRSVGTRVQIMDDPPVFIGGAYDCTVTGNGARGN